MINSKKISLSIILLTIIILKIINFNSLQKISVKSNNKILSNQEEHFSYIESKDKKQVPIPNGYVQSILEDEQYVDKGFVIYDESVNWEKIENLEEEEKKNAILQIQSKSDQYVWVPVSNIEIDDIYGIDSSGKICGKLYSYGIENWSQEGWKILNGDYYNIKGRDIYLEPSFIASTGGETLDDMVTEKTLNKTKYELYIELEQMYYRAIKSIKKYGGFYIGRYETGIENGEAVVRRMNEEISNQTWYEMYKKTKKIRKDNDNIETSLIWGSLWDHTLKWFVNTNAKSYEEMNDAIEYGNYTDSTFEYYKNLNGELAEKISGDEDAKIIPAGSWEETKINNIYDMAGNAKEFTLESFGKNFALRGGGYKDTNSSNKKCSGRTYNSISHKLPVQGSRIIMILK